MYSPFYIRSVFHLVKLVIIYNILIMLEGVGKSVLSILFVLFYLHLAVANGKQCKGGFVPNCDSKDHCLCGAYPGMDCFHWDKKIPDVLKSCWELGLWCGNISLLSNDSYNHFGVGLLPPLSFLVKYSIAELYLKEGTFLTQCKGNKSLSLFDGVTCVDCSSPNPVGAVFLYLLLNSIPIVVLFTVVVFFNINLASGLGHSFLFFYQIAPLVLAPLKFYQSMVNFGFHGASFLWDYGTGENPVINLIDTSAFLCVKKWTFSTIYMMRVCGLLVLFFLILLVLILARCISCPLRICSIPWSRLRRFIRNFRERFLPAGTVLTGVCSMIMVMYGGIYRIGSNLLSRMQIYYFPASNSCLRVSDIISPSVPVFSDWSSNDIDQSYRIILGVCTVVILVSGILPLLLIYKPCIPILFHKLTGKSLPTLSRLDALFDVFQGVYKPKCRFFAGLYFIYCFLLWSTNAITQNVVGYRFTLTCFLIIFLAIHCFVQPFERRMLNYIETLFLLNLTIIAAFMQIQQNSRIKSSSKFYFNLSYVAVTLILLPIALLIMYIVYKSCMFWYRQRRGTQPSALEERMTASVNLLYRYIGDSEGDVQ